ncbi:MAG: DHHW family protein [Vallitalea sp.]|jgi:hypothetical protein|nr:DHHW family protein [Vallitalea sp.]
MKRYITGISFLVIIFALMILNIIAPDKEISEFQKRKLQKFPQISFANYLNGQFSNELDIYVKDQEIFSEKLSGIVSYINYNIFCKIENRNIVKNNKSLYENIKLNEFNINDFNNNIMKLMINFHKNKQYTVILPDKSFYLNDEFIHLDNEAFNKLKFKFIDYSKILDASDFYKTDIHITNEGSYKIYLQLKKEMNLIEDYNTQFISVSDNFLGYYAIKSMYTDIKDKILKPSNEIINQLKVTYLDNDGEYKTHNSCYFSEHLNTYDQYSFNLNGNKPVTIIENEVFDNNRELVIIKDSYGLSIAPYLAQHYKKVTMLDLRMMPMDFVKNYINNETEILYYYGFKSVNDGKMF